MDLLRLKLAARKKRSNPRFGYYNPMTDVANLAAIGLIPSKEDFDLGTPNLSRDENVVVMASNASSRSEVHMTLKWRPCPATKTVTLISKLRLSVNGDALHRYEYEHIETYEPTESRAYPGRYLEYGSNGNKLKYTLLFPYRRSRLFFRGHMKRIAQADNASEPEFVFVKLNLIISPTARTFDFLEQFDDSCVLQQLQATDGDAGAGLRKLSVADTVNKLLCHDVHENMARIVGDCSINNQSDPMHNIFLWGFVARYFVSEPESETSQWLAHIQCRRVRAYMSNGQSFSIGRHGLERDPSVAIDFGYVCLHTLATTNPMVKPIQVTCVDNNETKTNLLSLTPEVNKFKIAEICGQEYVLECCAERRHNGLPNFFEVRMNEKSGWACVTYDNELVDTQAERDAVAVSRSARDLAMEEWRLVCEKPSKLPPGAGTSTSSCESDTSNDEHLLVVDIGDRKCVDRHLVGAKAASLAQLRVFSQREPKPLEQFYVPDGFVLTRHAYDKLLEREPTLAEAVEQLEQVISCPVDNDGDTEEDMATKQAKYAERLREECSRCVQLFEETPLPVAIRDPLKARLEALDPGHGHGGSSSIRFAVRSSSWGEDEADMSAAGQLSSILDSQGFEAISKAVMACYASKFLYANIEYKRQRGMRGPVLPMAVVIQKMCAARQAGVMFTCDPTNGDDSLLLVTANYGLGESVVSGQAEPDTIRVRVSSRVVACGSPLDILERPSDLRIEQVNVGSKQVVLSSAGDSNALDQLNKGECCLTNGKALRLARCGLELVQYFSQGPRDIEWAFDEQDKLCLLQARPVTGLDAFKDTELMHELDRPSRAELEFSSRANLCEVTPYAIKPITLTFSLNHWRVSAMQLQVKYMSDADYSAVGENEVFFDSFHMFFSIRCSSFLVLDTQPSMGAIPLSEPRGEDTKLEAASGAHATDGSTPGSKPEMSQADSVHHMFAKAMEIGFFGREVGPLPEVADASRGLRRHKSPFEGFKFDLYTWQLRKFPRRVALKQKAVIKRIREQTRAKIASLDAATGTGQSLSNASSAGQLRLQTLYRILAECMRDTRDSWENHIVVIMENGRSNFGLLTALAKFIRTGPRDLYAAMAKFLAIPRVLSAEIPHKIERMVDLICELGWDQAIQFGEHMNNKQALGLLTDDHSMKDEQDENVKLVAASLREEFADFMERFGHRCYNEFELAEPSWSEDKMAVVDMLRQNTRARIATQQSANQAADTPGENGSSENTSADNSTTVEQLAKSRREKRGQSGSQQSVSQQIDAVLESLSGSERLSESDRNELRRVIVPRCHELVMAREFTKDILIDHVGVQREVARKLASELCRQARLPDSDLFYYLALDELGPICTTPQPAIVAHAARRRQLFKRKFTEALRFDEIIKGAELKPLNWQHTSKELTVLSEKHTLHGTTASSGKARGRACLVHNYGQLARVQSGDILVAYSTDIAFSPLFPLVSGIITETGGLISHGAVVAREYGLPSVLGVPNIMQILEHGEQILLDADAGQIVRLDRLNQDNN